MFHTTQCAWSSVVLLRATSMSRMLRKKDCVPGGTFTQLIAGDRPSPVATPGAAWLNFTGISAPSANPATVKVRAGAAGAAAAPRCPAGCCAANGITASKASVETTNHVPGRIQLLLLPSIRRDVSVLAAPFRHDGFYARQHRHQRRDFPGAAGRRLHVVGPKRQREEVLAAEGPERLASPRARVDRGAKVRGKGVCGRAAHGRIGRGPAAVGLGLIDLPAAVRSHAAGRSQAGDMVTVDLAPYAPRRARCVPLQERAFVEALANAVNPSPAERHIQRLRGRHGGESGTFLVDLQPELRLPRVVSGQP